VSQHAHPANGASGSVLASMQCNRWRGTGWRVFGRSRLKSSSDSDRGLYDARWHGRERNQACGGGNAAPGDSGAVPAGSGAH
jgi:hypothetical protein